MAVFSAARRWCDIRVTIRVVAAAPRIKAIFVDERQGTESEFIFAMHYNRDLFMQLWRLFNRLPFLPARKDNVY